MYTMDSEKRPSRPVILSQSSANQEFTQWLKENRYEQLRDGEGTLWTLKIHMNQVPDPEKRQELALELQIELSADVTAEELVKCGVLNRTEDMRLVKLLGESRVPLRFRRHRYMVQNEEKARALLVEVIPQIRKNMQENQLVEIKRQLVGRFIDEQKVFGSKKD